MKYIGSNRDLYSYIRKEKRYLIQSAKENRTTSQVDIDTETLQDIESSLKIVNDKVTSLNFVKDATQNINKELKELSFHHSKQEVVFDIGVSDTSMFIDNIQLASQVNGKSLSIGGDGRNNQIFLALWAARNEVQDVDPLEVVIYCIEEPEAHLHPHQQRKLAEYLYKVLKSQVIITSHSPQITSESERKREQQHGVKAWMNRRWCRSRPRKFCSIRLKATLPKSE
nr:AAA family ATPase [Desulfosporosinus sp. I2]